ncbi:hypothetical protein Agub_g11024 [Astrephomene gubernaculifera]|uniref:EF-hand domain-containing protein n=1 Tax=Astrephomene gubernaculifera TaxID=47775 RepID=A0AAD3DW79_9CHLO|nr:hypothetical protein Agub_g11024 [Astrephomene gubernaculifera]
MGCSGSKSIFTRESPLSEALERKLIDAVITTKKRKGHVVKKSSFNNLMLQLPKLTSGFKKIRDAYSTATAPTGKVSWGTFRALCGPKLGLDPTSETLKEVLILPQVDAGVPVTHADLIVLFTVVFLLDDASKRRTIASPDVRGCLDLMEKSFMFFDSSADGCIERKELALALKSGTKVFGRKASKTLADRLFDQLDWSKDGQITFKEYLVGMERIIIETAGEEEEDMRQLGLLGGRAAEEEEQGEQGEGEQQLLLGEQEEGEDPRDVDVGIVEEGPQQQGEGRQQATAESGAPGLFMPAGNSLGRKQPPPPPAAVAGLSMFPDEPYTPLQPIQQQQPQQQQQQQQQQAFQQRRQSQRQQGQQQQDDGGQEAGDQFRDFERERMPPRPSQRWQEPDKPPVVEPAAVPDSTDEVRPFTFSGMGEPESPVRKPAGWR